MHGESRNNNPPAYHNDPPFYLRFFVVPNCTEFRRQAKYLGTSAKARDHSRCIAGTQLLFQTDSYAHLLFQDLKKGPYSCLSSWIVHGKSRPFEDAAAQGGREMRGGNPLRISMTLASLQQKHGGFFPPIPTLSVQHHEAEHLGLWLFA
jgi:hypothetical protein